MCFFDTFQNCTQNAHFQEQPLLIKFHSSSTLMRHCLKCPVVLLPQSEESFELSLSCLCCQMVTATRTTFCPCVRTWTVKAVPSTWPSQAHQRYITHTVTMWLYSGLIDWQSAVSLLQPFFADPFYSAPTCPTGPYVWLQFECSTVHISASLKMALFVLHNSGNSQYRLDIY